MIVTCSNCASRYAVDPLAVGPSGRTVECARCHHRWYQRVEVPPPPPDLVIRPPSPGATLMPFMDPAFIMAVCRYDLSKGALGFSVPISPAYTAVSFYTRTNVAFYAINDRAAGRRAIELELMTTQQRDELPGDEDVTAADRLIVESPASTGLILIKALVAEPGMLPAAREALAAARCRPR